MPFPQVERVVYGKSTLDIVTCQVRFPPILRVEAETPAAFQDLIRERFPLFSETQVDVAAQLPPGLVPAGADRLRVRTNRSYSFATEDGLWSVTLSKESMSMSTRAYAQWEAFRDCFRRLFDGLQAIYSPSFFTRVGLRYINIIVRSKLGLSADTPWSELMQPHIAGELSVLPQDQVEDARRTLIVRLEADARVRVKHLLALTDTGEQCFVIDSDFFVGKKTETSNAMETLASLNRYAGRLFRWCIQPRLHEAMDPSPV